jgi:orotate phosphoribosyltransferase
LNSKDDKLFELMSMRRGHFRFVSGHHGDIWLDLDRLFQRPDALRPFVDELAVRLARHRIDAVCGALVGGALLAQMIAATLDIDFHFTEPLRASGEPTGEPAVFRLPNSTQRVICNRRVAVVDDAINAGTDVRGTLDALRSCGAVPVVVGALLVLGETGANYVTSQGLMLETLVKIPHQLWAPAACPMCASGVPLDVAGSPI